MSLVLRHQQKQIQNLAITPQLQQSIKLLQLSRAELEQTIQEELILNPALELSEGDEGAEERDGLGVDGEARETSSADPARPDEGDGGTRAADRADELEWARYLTESMGGARGPSPESREERPALETYLTRPSALSDHLFEQLRLRFDDPSSRRIGVQIIGNLDSRGYLEDDVPSLARRCGVAEDEVLRVLEAIQRFDPLGVAGRDARECLLIQARVRFPQRENLHRLIADHLQDLERRDYARIARSLGIPKHEVAQEHERLRGLDPKPGLRYGGQSPRYITPDIRVEKIDDEWRVLLSDDGLPKLRISSGCLRLLRKNTCTPNERQYVRERVKSAEWLIKSIHQRQRTIYKVTESLVRFQRQFLDDGVEHLRPLVMKEVAEDIDMHESTVSRVTTNKYVDTPQGIFELKYFFSTGVDGVATEPIKHMIRHLIRDEDPHRPLSDQKIADLLRAEHDLSVARRTVSKYRKILGIPSSTLRRRR